MRWNKLGHIYGPDGTQSWANNTALTPTPFLRDDETIRVLAGFRDGNGISRIGYVDVDSRDPLRVKGVSTEPVLDVGRPGAFDDNGVILGDVLKVGDDIYLYYVGFQLVARAKFLAFTGLAVSRDQGASFIRVSDAPVLDRCQGGIYIRAIHSVLREGNVYRIWYACGDGWEEIGGKPFPRYNIRTLESSDGIHFEGIGKLCVNVQGSEYRIGRPRVFRFDGHYAMHYTRGTLEGAYLAGYAESDDGFHWVRRDSQLGITPSESGWDSRHLCYPAVLTCHGRTYLFYNGNDMGREGFGCAVLNEERG